MERKTSEKPSESNDRDTRQGCSNYMAACIDGTTGRNALPGRVLRCPTTLSAAEAASCGTGEEPVRKDGDGFATGRREAQATQPHLRHEATNPLCDARHHRAFAAARPRGLRAGEVLDGIASAECARRASDCARYFMAGERRGPHHRLFAFCSRFVRASGISLSLRQLARALFQG